LTVFNLQGLGDVNNAPFRQRVLRFAGFYLNEDPGALNYDPRHKIIRSLFNGSRGPLLRKATAVDWAGDPIEVQHRFRLGHGEENYEQMLAHFKDYNDIVGDHPQNLLATSLALNAYMLAGDDKYRRWLLEYVDAWRDRMLANDSIIPTNIGLDGTIGGETSGKWYGGVYGWAFSVVAPESGRLAHRNTHAKALTGFINAYLLTGDDRYLDPWRRQTDKINAAAKTIDGRKMTPRMYGDQGWYHFVPEPYTEGAVEIYYLTMRDSDRQRVPRRDAEWLRFLEGGNPDFPERALRADLNQIRSRTRAMRQDITTPDTRLSDDPMKYNPASVNSLIHLTLGGLHPGRQGNVLQCRLRYFDPLQRRAGLPPDVAALVTELTADSVKVTLVNVSQLESRRVTIQAGGYAEHQFVAASVGGRAIAVNDDTVQVRLEPGAGGEIALQMKRYANRPTLLFPWDR
jgi:hypothetical protein